MPSIPIKNISPLATPEPIQKVETGPGETALYFKNNGLFSDTYLLHHLPDTKQDSFILEHWETEPLPDFSAAYEWMMSTWSEMKDILPKLNEAQLEERWVRPILKLLGWELEVQDRLQRRGRTQIPDYSLFDNLDAYKKAKSCKTDDAYFEKVLAIADAKAMGIHLDGTSRSNSNPSYQIIRYLEDTRKPWGILTDGRYWRLYSTRSTERFSAYFEVNIEKLLSKRDDERFKYFFNFFRKQAFVRNATSGQSFLDVVFEGGEQYAREIETTLKLRGFRVVEMLCKGFSKSNPKMSAAEQKRIYDHSLYYLFRLMFVLNCEAKSLLNVSKQSDYYVYSLRSLCVKLKEEFEASTSWSDGPRSYNYISDLFDLLREGDERIGIHGLGKEMFSSGDPDFYKNHRIPDSILNYVLVDLALSYDEAGTLKFIDYKRLSSDHLGSLFEGLLEYHLGYAETKLVRDEGTVREWTDLSAKNKEKFRSQIIEKGNLYLADTNTERKNSGSYYTPQYIISFVVAQTIGPLVKDKSIDEILALKIVDTSMGSSPFLLGTISFLEEKILDRMSKEETNDLDPQSLRWQILHSCINGVDINPLAVELAKFSLWMFTARAGYKLEPLEDQLYCGDSFVDKEELSTRYFSYEDVFSSTFSRKNPGFDVIVSNPPWGRCLSREQEMWAKTRYSTIGKEVDTYTLFIQRSHELLRTGGKLGCILPSTYLVMPMFGNVRKYLIEQFDLDLVGLIKKPVFKDATVESSILLSTKVKTPNEEYSFASFSDIDSVVDGQMAVSLRKYNVGPVRADEEHRFNVNMDQEAMNLVNKIQTKFTQKLEDSCEVRSGIMTNGDALLSDTKKNKNCKPLLRGKNVGRGILIGSSGYIEYDETLAKKHKYQLRDERIFLASPKIVIRQTGDSLICAIDSDKHYALKNTHLILVKEKEQATLSTYKALAVLLNSQVMNYLYQCRVPERNRAMAEVKADYVKALPCPSVDVLLKAGLDKLYEALAKADRTDKSETHIYCDVVDKAVAKLFGLSASDMEIIRAHFEVLKEATEEVDAA